MISEELHGAIEDLLRDFELDSGDWPILTIWSQGSFYTGPIADELYNKLVTIKELLDEEDIDV